MVKVNIPPAHCTFCGSNKITTAKDAGFDVDPEGEERQHIDHCVCGAERLWGIFYPLEGEPHMWHGAWQNPHRR